MRQRRPVHVQVAKADKSRHIRHDAKGIPSSSSYRRVCRPATIARCKACEAGWRATGDPWAVAEAHTLTLLHRQVPPAWLDDAVWALAVKRRTKAHAKRAQEAAIRLHAVRRRRDAHRLEACHGRKLKVRAVEVLADDAAAAKSGHDVEGVQAGEEGPQEGSRRLVLHTEKAAPVLGVGTRPYTRP